MTDEEIQALAQRIAGPDGKYGGLPLTRNDIVHLAEAYNALRNERDSWKCKSLEWEARWQARQWAAKELDRLAAITAERDALKVDRDRWREARRETWEAGNMVKEQRDAALARIALLTHPVLSDKETALRDTVVEMSALLREVNAERDAAVAEFERMNLRLGELIVERARHRDLRAEYESCMERDAVAGAQIRDDANTIRCLRARAERYRAALLEARDDFDCCEEAQEYQARIDAALADTSEGP